MGVWGPNEDSALHMYFSWQRLDGISTKKATGWRLPPGGLMFTEGQANLRRRAMNPSIPRPDSSMA